MIETTGDLFNRNGDAICITTNGFIKTNGCAVMGKGCAKRASELVPKLDQSFGLQLKKNKNIVQTIAQNKFGQFMVSFPVKPFNDICVNPEFDVVEHMRYKFKTGHIIPGWACVASLKLIEKSAKQLVKLANELGWKKVIVPRPGCGAGELKWEDVKKILEPILDDRFEVITFG